MTLNLLKRAEKGSALSATEHDDNLTAIETEVNGKAESSHAHSIANVTGLQTALDAKETPAGAQSKADAAQLAAASDATTKAAAAQAAAISTAAADATTKANAAQAAAIAAAATDATAKVSAHAAAADPHPAYALESSLATVATSGAYADLSGKPTLGTAAATDATAYATAAQGAKADSAMQAADVGTAASQAEAEAGTGTAIQRFSVLRVWQAIAAWWLSASTSAGRALVTAADAAAQRTALGLDAVYALLISRVTFSDAAYTITAARSAVVVQAGTLTAPRVVTLPAASAFRAGDTLDIVDESGTVTATNTLTITRAGSDTINGATTAVIGNAYGGRKLVSDGSSKWSFDGGVVRQGAVTGSGLTMATAKLLGRSTAGTGAPEEITLGTNLSLTGTTLNAAGGGGSPGGSDGQIQRNSGGAFGGSNISQDAAGRVTVAAGTQTTAGSALTVTYTANGSGQTISGLTINATDTASSASSLLQDWQINSTSLARVNKSGSIRAGAAGNSVSDPSVQWNSGAGATHGWYSPDVNTSAFSSGGTQRFRFSTSFMFFSGSDTYQLLFGNSADLGFQKSAANTMEINNGTAGTQRDLKLRNLIATQIIQTTAQTVATLPAAASWPGAEAYVTDANGPTVGSAVASGSSAKVVVRSNGTNWIVTAII